MSWYSPVICGLTWTHLDGLPLLGLVPGSAWRQAAVDKTGLLELVTMIMPMAEIREKAPIIQEVETVLMPYTPSVR